MLAFPQITCIIVLWCAIFVSSAARAQYRGGSGDGNDMSESAEVIFPMIYYGGSGRGDATAKTNTIYLFNRWADMENNRVVTWDALNDGRVLFRFNSNGTLPTGLQGVAKLNVATYGVTPIQSGLHATILQKPNNQLLIRGDFRSVLIATTAGQTACVAQANYPQLLWLDTDLLQLNVTRCYADKTLTTLYTQGNGTSWYNISGGGAIRINASGVVVGISCY